ncbi:MAG TPA: sel1 repeat family protein [Epsilonproteobacteria bacterium]|nr:sel1 repeat family protein [Campylobacterota bacterium]
MQNGDMRGCNNLGLMRELGQGIRQDNTQAANLYKQAYDGNLTTSCVNLGIFYMQGRGVKKTLSKLRCFFKMRANKMIQKGAWLWENF